MLAIKIKIKDENDMIAWNKSQLGSQGYTQIEGINFEEIFSLVSLLEFVRLLIGLARYFRFMLYQIDMKSAFLDEVTKEGIYVE